MAHVTLGEAARQTGRSKSQISRAIRDGKLSAERSVETGSFKIEQSELRRWQDVTTVVRATAAASIVEDYSRKKRDRQPKGNSDVRL